MWGEDCHTEKYNAQKKEKERKMGEFCILIIPHHTCYLLPPALALATLSKDSLMGVLLTNTVK